MAGSCLRPWPSRLRIPQIPTLSERTRGPRLAEGGACHSRLSNLIRSSGQAADSQLIPLGASCSKSWRAVRFGSNTAGVRNVEFQTRSLR